jgi:hypothetical protein
MTTFLNGVVVYGAIAMRSKKHTPGAGYTERDEIMSGSGGSAASVAVEDQTIASASTVAVDGSFIGATDWAVVALTIKPAPSSALSKSSELAASAIPLVFALEQNHPNPFNPSTMISFALPFSGKVTVNIYNESGQLVRTLVEGERAAGYYSLRWNGRNQSGKTVAAGIYLYQIVVRSQDGNPAFTQTRRMLFLK